MLAWFNVAMMPAQAAPGYALLFNGRDSYVSTTVPVLASNYTLSAWVNLRRGGNYDTSRVGLLTGSSGGNSVEFLIRSETANAADPQYLELGRSGAFSGQPSTNAVPLNQWVQVTITVSSNKLVSYFINGAAAGSWDASGLNVAVGPAIFLGSQNLGRHFDGLLDEVQIWSRALTPVEIQASRVQSPDVADGDLVAYWPFSEGMTGHATTADASGHGHPGTLVKFPHFAGSPVGWVPEVSLNGANPLTNELHTVFTDPGAVVCAAAAGIAAGYGHSLALQADGMLGAWGNNAYGQTNIPAAATNVITIVVGSYHNLALQADGTVVAWGNNAHGQTNVPVKATNVVAIAAGGAHSLALLANGSVVAWGWNGYGQATVPATATNIVAIAGGAYHSLGLKADGRVVTWGYNNYGQTNVPAAATNVVAIAGGEYHSLGLKADGTVVAWGNSDYGQTTVPAMATNVVAIAGGSRHSLGLKADGTVVAWGYNSSGQTNVPAAATNVVAIAGGENYSLALKADGTVVGWGYNSDGQTNVPSFTQTLLATSGTVNTNVTGTYTLTYSYTNSLGTVLTNNRTVVVAGVRPVILSQPANVSALVGSAAQLSVLARDSDPMSYQWYRVNQGALAGATNAALAWSSLTGSNAGAYYVVVRNDFGATISRSALVVPLGWQLNGANPLTNALHSPFTDPGVALTMPMVAVAGGGLHSLVLKADGTVVCWGNNDYGQTNMPATATNVVALASGGYHSLALRADGTVVAWGDNSVGQTNVPATATNIVALAGGAFHSLALQADRTVVAWGYNSDGQTTVPATATNVVALAGGWLHSLALKADGTVLAWGNNDYGQTTVPASATNVVALAAGYAHSLALQADGTVLAWGYNSDGQTTVPASATNVVALAGGVTHSLALKADGTVVAWGDNSVGLTNVPTTATNVVAIAAGYSHSLALKADGTVVAWGWNGYGQTDMPTFARTILATSGMVNTAAADTYTLTYSYTNSWGTVLTTNRTVVVVSAPPVIVGQPANLTAFTGSAGQLSVSATSLAPLAAPLSYQWYWQNHGALAGATNRTLAWSSLAVSNAGIYYVVVSNVSGVAISRLALVDPVNWQWLGANPQTNLIHAACPDPGATLTTPMVAVAGGGYHSLALKADGAVVAWGYNNYGQTKVPAMAKNVVAIAGGGYHSLALQADGRVVAWGYDGNGLANVPATATNVVAIAGVGYHSLALKADGVVVAWGDNGYGQTNIPANATNVVAIAGGYSHSLALKVDGTVVAWGDNGYGQTNVPANATNIVAIAAGEYHSLALKADGTVVVWGWNKYSQTNVPSFAQTLLATSGTVNSDIVGTYTLTYLYFNSWGEVLTTNRTVVVWQAAQNPPILANLAVTGGSVGFTLSGDSGQTVVVETCTNLTAPVWVPVQTNTLGGSPVNFSAPVQTPQPQRFYRLRTP